jgi:hypothetical protein
LRNTIKYVCMYVCMYVKNVSQNRIFSPLRVGYKIIENEPPLVLKLMNFICLVPRRFSLGIEISGKTMGVRGLMGMR